MTAVVGGASVIPLSQAPSLVDLERTLEEFRRSMVAGGRSKVTITDRLTMIQAFAKHDGIDPRFASVDDIISWLSRPDLAAWSRSTYYGHLRAWFGWLRRTGRREDDPTEAIQRPQQGRSAPRPLSEGEVAALFAAAKPRMRTWLTLGLYAGLRAHEIAKFRGVDVNQDTLFVLGKGGHGRELPTHPDVWAQAQRHGQGFWFPSRGRDGHITPESLSHMTSLFFTSLGIEGAIHRCRHTYATKLLRAGVNIRVVQQLMRHESLQTTARYTAVYEADMREGVLQLLSQEAAQKAASITPTGLGSPPLDPREELSHDH